MSNWIDTQGFPEAQRRLANLPNNVRRVTLRAVAQKVLENSKKRVINQTGVEGSAWAARKKGRKKMLVKVGRQLKIVAATDDEAVISWNNKMANIAAIHQFGITQTMSVDDVKRRPNQQAVTDPATRIQAKALIDAGYKRRRPNGRGYITPTIKWITENMTIAQAGVILRQLRGSKRTWQIPIPARTFLGIADSEREELTNIALTEAQNAI